MASLDKLAIRGIRSFDDKQISVIEFFTPVTVIVGHNGSGKTTIIECLKYATTGDQPPNTRGGAFVHDPKMANEKEVKAQVKLRFWSANKTRMLAVRNLSVTMKKTGALTMKTLESILAVADEKKGNRGAISTKCAEMDAEIPNLLGVSKAVLENVIFCHQEDSYWPLSEPSILKKKFDDIFEATKYTKALDNIKALRKERVADLKAEKERLESLQKEKTHADKLKTRISDLTSTISSKQLEYEETKNRYNDLVKANARFYESATKFRETYMKVDTLNEKKSRYEEELAGARENVRELDGTDQELADRLKNFDDHVMKQKQKQRSETEKAQDIEEELSAIRKEHVKLVGQQGQLVAEEKAQEQRIADREELIREISATHNIKGYDHAPLDRHEVTDFIEKLKDLKRRQNLETDKLQEDSRTRSDEYNSQSMQLHAVVQGHKQQKADLKIRIASTQSRLTQAEVEVDRASALASQLRSLQIDIEEKERRIEGIKEEIKGGNFDQRLSEMNSKSRSMELRRDELTAEIRALSLQADARARLDLKRTELKNKTTEMHNTIQMSNPKFRKLVDRDAQPDTMERDLERVAIEKEREHADLGMTSNIASKSLQVAEATLSSLKSQSKAKQDEVKMLDRKISAGLTFKIEEEELIYESVDKGLQECNTELSLAQEELGKASGADRMYRSLLNDGKTRKCCPLCARSMDSKVIATFEKALQDLIKKTTPESVKELTEFLQGWQGAVRHMQDLAALNNARKKLAEDEIPSLQAQIKKHEEEYPGLTKKAEDAQNELDKVTRELKDIAALRQQASLVSQLQKDIERLKREISTIESELMTTGSTKTADDLQEELDTLSTNMRANDRDKQALMTDRERLNNALRLHDSEFSGLKVRESEVKSQVREKANLEARIKEWKEDIANFTAQLKDLDAKISDAQAPIEQLEREWQAAHRELNAKIVEAQRTSQEVNMSTDKLDNITKSIDRYAKERRGRRLKECNERVAELEEQIKEHNIELEQVRNSIRLIDKEISESAASMSNLRENLRIRRLRLDIAATQAEIDSIDLEEAAKAKRIFEEKYNIEKQKETQLQSTYAHIGGEISSLQAQLETLQVDMRDFENISKKYRDQLIRVKMSDMANNDLEKYAKALESAIMKYHTLKMEELNDTMRHLWNKTYQGTDIDGIKIRSDMEGGVSKRSYNYRVVMMKDSVEMDMRGRCSAGQKMLASIIIRLALADSFGQNCGILALDEPTNALDTENIDALAASLVDIINERKSNSNFQLIIITHDENFLRKLGQADVMENYWRVVRDSRQKSVIERHRFG
ncbi:hypothetical protein EVJ58_g1346 [Rhodofomes roseus]|uniref:DNA repair protein RAD50 n=1 Tax=Rhodofomes roseus TaxID=34475 RepID=A0A4Y9Z1E9_9APHY|nr:hypothetical protein EVJ58_g1346 [Rhodofomes roseus]